MAKAPAKNEDSNPRIVCRNRRASHEYEILQKLECGIMLAGSEVKSVRANKISIEEAYVKVRDGAVWLVNCDINEYPQATTMNHITRRTRKLLLHRREITKFAEAAADRGLTIIPLDVHFVRGLVKLTIAVARGRKLHDKREKLKSKSDQREIQQAMRRNAR
jgi:SsrA-binding protein